MTPALAAAAKNIRNAAGEMNRRKRYILYRISLVLFSAMLLALAFSSFNLEFLAWFALVPLLFTLEGKSTSRTVYSYTYTDELIWAFLVAYFCGILFFAFSMYWLIYVTITGWILLSFYQGLYFGIFGFFFCYFTKLSSSNAPFRSRHRPPQRKVSSEDKGLPTLYTYFAISSAWVILEYIRSHLGGGIGWNLLGYSQYKNLPVIQIADITGVCGVSFLVILMNVAVYSAIKMAIKCYKKDPKPKIKSNLPFRQELKINPVVQTLVVLLLFIVILVYGYKNITAHRTPLTASHAPFKISVVQGNIPQRFKWREEFIVDILNRYENLTEEAAEDNPQLIIWPETAVPGYLNYDEILMRWTKRLVRKIKTPLLIGAPMASKSGLDTSFNSAMLFSDRGVVLGRYDKLHLVAFGEFIPFEKQLPFLRKLLPITGSYIPGDEYTVFKLPTTNNQSPITNLSVLICFEDIFPGLVRQFVKRGADFMVNITNDAWFRESCAPYQHAANSVLRAVENRRPFIRSTNTGLSCFIDKTGKIYERVSANGKDLFVHGAKTASIGINKDKILTFYTKYGDIFILVCVIILVIDTAKRIFLTI